MTAPAHPIRRQDLQEVADCVWEIPQTVRADMRVPARVFADEPILEAILHDRSLEQLVNVATLPGITGYAMAMPDVHEGYGFPVGGVAGMAAEGGVVSPGGVGYDINCGVRLLASDRPLEELRPRLEAFVHEISRSIPSGPRHGGLRLDPPSLDGVLSEVSAYVVRELGLGLERDLDFTESRGRIEGADPARVSARAKQRGHDQLGTLGSGNHFVEVQEVERVFDREAGTALGLEPGAMTVLIHTGSRGLGHQVCTDFVRLLDVVMPRYGIHLPDRQLACAQLDSPEGRDYLGAMGAAANFAWANRQVIAQGVRRAAERTLAPVELRLVYDVAHNVAKFEQHEGRRVCVHRKGATRAFGPSNPETPEPYRAFGQPVFIPGSMGTASYVLAGSDRSEQLSLGSACHGAGRRMSRSQAKREVSGAELRRQLEARGIVVRCASNKGLAEEAPLAYKDVDEVVRVVDEVGLARRIARLRPAGVVKG